MTFFDLVILIDTDTINTNILGLDMLVQVGNHWVNAFGDLELIIPHPQILVPWWRAPSIGYSRTGKEIRIRLGSRTDEIWLSAKADLCQANLVWMQSVVEINGACFQFHF